jgi:hypothetical protein
MVALRREFDQRHHSCYYFFPDFRLFSDLARINGDMIGHSFLVDVAGLPNIIPPTHRTANYHNACLDTASSCVTFSSEPFVAHTLRAERFLRNLNSFERERPPKTTELLRLTRRLDRENRRLTDYFFRNAALVVLPGVM